MDRQKSACLHDALHKATSAERNWLTAVLDCTAVGPVSLQDIWSNTWFTQESGLSLIIQPQHESAFLYTPSSIDSADVHYAEMLSFAILLELIINTGIPLLYRPSSPRPSRLVYIGAIFDAPKVEWVKGKPRIVLNKVGDYTEDPATIVNDKGEVAYRSLSLRGDAYELIRNTTRGMIFIRKAECDMLHKMLFPPKLTKERPPSKRLNRGVLSGFGFGRGWSWTTKGKSRSLIEFLIAIALLVGGAGTLGYCAGVLWDHTGRKPLAFFDHTAAAQSSPSLLPVISASQFTDKYVYASPINVTPQLPLISRPVGVDVSQWSGKGKAGAEAVFDTVDRLDFAFARAAYGTRKDPEFAINWRLLGEKGIYRGAYLFLRLGENVEAQVSAAVQSLEPALPKDWCLAIDFEEMSMLPSSRLQPADRIQALVLRALAHAENVMKCVPILYTNANMAAYLKSPAFERYPLWIAEWTPASQPHVPLPWRHFSIWQRSNHTRLSPHPADFDVFNGTSVELPTLSRFRPSVPSLIR